VLPVLLHQHRFALAQEPALRLNPFSSLSLVFSSTQKE